MFSTLCIGFLMLAVTESDSVCLEYKAVTPNRPGRLGSIRYQTVWIQSNRLRIDLDSNVSKILDLEASRQVELDHQARRYRVTPLDGDSARSGLVFMRTASSQTWQGKPCRIYLAKEKDGTEVEVWFGDLDSVPADLMLNLLVGVGTQFAEETPTGFPVRVIIRTDGYESLELSLISSRRQSIPKDHFGVPTDYVENR